MKIRNRRRLLIGIYMLGFLLGILFLNCMSKKYILDMGIWSESFRTQYRNINVSGWALFPCVLYSRFLPFVILIGIGRTRYRMTGVHLFLGWTGVISGMLMTSAIMALGVKGILLLLIGLMPHAVCYIVVYVVLISVSVTAHEVRRNSFRDVCLSLLMLLGMILESFVNPIVLQMFLKTL